jgi:hypothetical protein
MGDQFPAIPVIAGRSTYYVRPTIQGVATGGVKKFVGSRHAEMTMPMKKSYWYNLKLNDDSDRCTTAYRYEFVKEDQAKGGRRVGIQSKDTCRPSG